MADGKVLLEVVVEGKNVKVVQRQVEGVTGAVNENTTAQRRNTKATQQSTDVHDHFNRGLKGVGQSSLSSGKALSKMRDIVGSSGFVGAYATLAANLFAASAAFTALNNAAKSEQLTKSLEMIGTRTGSNLLGVAKGLREITGEAITMQQSMQAASLGISAGFDQKQLQDLARVAKGASAALGRDLSDSYDRLIRGAAKLEPEILDELGIIVRIKDATEKYAISIGKTANELTTYERQQAFVNAINEQGSKKFGYLADSIDPTPIERLSASLQNLTNSFVKFISNTLRLPEFFNYLADNVTALTGAVVIFASTISRQMLPAVYALPMALGKWADTKAIKSISDYTKNIDGLLTSSVQLGKGAKDSLSTFNNALKNGTATGEQLAATQATLTRSAKVYEAKVTSLNAKLVSHQAAQRGEAGAIALTDAQLVKLNKDLGIYNAKLTQTQAANIAAAGTFKTITAAQAGTQIASSIANIGGNLDKDGQTVGFFKSWGNLLKGIGTSFSTLTPATNVFGKALNLLKGAFTALTGVGSGLLSTLLRFSGWIGVFITLAPYAADLWRKFFPEDETKKKRAEIEKFQVGITDFFSRMQKTQLMYNLDFQTTGLDKTTQALDIFVNTLQDLINTLETNSNKLVEQAAKTNFETMGGTAAQARIGELSQQKAVKEQRLQEITPTSVEDPKFIQYFAERQKIFGEIKGIEASITEQQGSLVDIYKRAESVAKSQNNSITLLQAKGAVERYKSTITPQLQELEKNAPGSEGTINKMIEEVLKKNNPEEIYAGLKLVQTQYASLRAGMAESAQLASATSAEIAKVIGKQDTPWTGMIKAIDAQLLQRDSFSRQISELETKLKGMDKESPEGKILQTELGNKRIQQNILTQALQESAKAAGLQDISNVAGIRSLAKQAETQSIALEASKKKFEDYKAALVEISKVVPMAKRLILEEQRKVNTQEIALLQTQLKLPLASEKRAELESRIASLKENTVNLSQEELEYNQAVAESLAQQQKSLEEINNLQRANAKLSQEIANYAITGSTELTLQQQFDFLEEEKTSKIAMANLEFEVLKSKLIYNQKVLELTYKGIAAEAKAQAQKDAALAKANPKDMGLQQAANTSAATAAGWADVQKLSTDNFNRELDYATRLHNAKIRNIELETKKTAIGLSQGAESTVKGQVSTILPEAGQKFDTKAYAASIADAGTAAKQAQSNLVDSQMAGVEGQIKNVLGQDFVDFSQVDTLTSKLQELQTKKDAIAAGADPLTNMKVGIAQASVAMTPFIESLKTLGPDGELVAAIASGTIAIADSFTTLADKSASTADKFAAVGAIISSVAAMSNAAGAAKVASIDKEINAEKKRDGKSKESLAKIASLEAKKESIEKKNFERNKKLQMASTIINTAAAMMKAIADLGPIAGPIMAVALGAMGAAQLAIIAGTSYQGGASTGGGASIPSSVSAGERKSTIDLAKSQSASGELSYMQGDKGIGGPENFRPAFIGSRAAGGRVNAGYMVGEQGPELFVPKVPGRIVPADKVNNAPAQNVNISISALDASGVEQVLIKQRGHIIGMIREAANSYGEKFLESVDTRVYTQPSTGYNGVAKA